MRKVLEIGGFVAATVLVVFGIGVIVIGVQGRNTVHTSLKQEQIVGSDDMTPAQIKLDAAAAGLPASTSLPTIDIAGQEIDNGTKARAFASYMRIHALEASGGLTYSQLPRFETADGKGTSDATMALQADGKPVANQARATWVTATALSTALNTSYMAESLSLFAIVVGIALLLCGIGFAILAAGGALRHGEPAVSATDARPPTSAAPPVPVV